MSPLSFYRAEKRVFPCLAEPPTAVLDPMYLGKPSAMKTSNTSESVRIVHSVHPPVNFYQPVALPSEFDRAPTAGRHLRSQLRSRVLHPRNRLEKTKAGTPAILPRS